MSGDVRAARHRRAGTLTLGTVSGTRDRHRAQGAGARLRQHQRRRAALEPPGRAADRQDRSTATSTSTAASPAAAATSSTRTRATSASMLANITGFELDASTFSGSIRSDFPVTLRSTARRRPARPPRHEQPRDPRHVRRRQRDPRDPQLLGHRRHHEEVEYRQSQFAATCDGLPAAEAGGRYCRAAVALTTSVHTPGTVADGL